MQVNLVFSPFAELRIPLGIALLKSYVEQRSDFKLTCFDLNALYHNTIDSEIRSPNGRIEMSEEDVRAYSEAIDVFKTKNPKFFDLQTCHSSAVTFRNSFTKLKEFFDRACSDALKKNQSPPWFLEQHVDLLLSNRPDVIGFSIMFPEQFYYALLAARMIKAAKSNIKVVFGGGAMSAIYTSVLTHRCVDFTVLNEGEEALLTLLEALRSNQGLRCVPNLAFKQGGRVMLNERIITANLNDLPFPDFSGFDLNSYWMPEPVIPVLGSRGCYWRRCAFCVHHKSYFNKYRVASVERVVDELEHHVRNGLRYFSFVDEMIPAKRFSQIGREILHRKLQLCYFALAKPTADFTEETCRIMYESGCRYILWGVESGCQKMLDLIDKGTNVPDIAAVLAHSAKAGIKNHPYIIIGFPSETKDDFRKTLDFLYQSRDNIHALHTGAFVLHKGSKVYENPAKFCITKTYSDHPINAIKYDVSKGLTTDQALRYREFFSNSYFRHFTYLTPMLGQFRHYVLLLYANEDQVTFNINRHPVPSPDQVGFPVEPAQVTVPRQIARRARHISSGRHRRS